MAQSGTKWQHFRKFSSPISKPRNALALGCQTGWYSRRWRCRWRWTRASLRGTLLRADRCAVWHSCCRRRCRGVPCPSTSMRTHMPGCTGIIAQTIEAKGNKKSFAAVMLEDYAGSRGRSSRWSTAFRTTKLPPPDMLGVGSFRMGVRRGRRRRCRGVPCPSTSMRTHMPGCTGIIAQSIEAKGNKKSFAAVMLEDYAGWRSQSSRSLTTFRTTRWPPPDTLGLGSFRLGSAPTVRFAPDRRVGLDGLQPIIDPFHGATHLGLDERRAKEPLDLPRDFRLGQVALVPKTVSIHLLGRRGSPIANPGVGLDRAAPPGTG